MTREDLCRVLETFAIASIATAQTIELTPEEQHDLIVKGIESVADTVLFASKRDALRYSIN